MRIICQECGSKYKISAERIKGPVARAKCRKCGAMMEVKNPNHKEVFTEEPTRPRQLDSGDEKVDDPGTELTNPHPAPPPGAPKQPLPQVEYLTTLCITAADGSQQRFYLPVGTFTLGAQGSTLVLPSPDAVANQATLTVMPDSNVILQDQGRAAPIQVNGKAAPLSYFKPGDHVQIAGVTLALEPPPTPERPSAPSAQTPTQPGPPSYEELPSAAVSAVSTDETSLGDQPTDSVDHPATPQPPRTPAPPARQTASPPPSTGPRPPAAADATKESEFAFFDEDDDEDEVAFEEPFSLEEHLLQSTPVSEGPRESYLSAQVIRMVDGRVQDDEQLEGGAIYTSPAQAVRVQMSGATANLWITTETTGQLLQQGNAYDLAAAQEQNGLRSTVLNEGDSAVIQGADGTYKVHVFRPAKAPKSLFEFNPALVFFAVLAAVLHLGMAYGIGELGPIEAEAVEEAQDEVFAEATIEQPEPEKPKQKPKPKDTLRLAEKAPAVSTKTVQKAQEKKTSASVENLVKLLAKNTGAKGESSALKDNISNIDAVKSTGGSAFDIAGAIGSLGENAKVNIARSGGGGVISTMGSEDVKAETSLGEAKKGEVRGRVTKLSSQARVQGSLARDEVMAVINKNGHKIQRCYETALMKSGQAVSGKVAMEWVIATSGAVKSVRVASSTMSDASVASCMSAEIKKWTFPQPKGGEVTIVFPWIFRAM